ncbi:hypothetical protein [Streptomyces sp. NPDC050535]|uniref:hypothetical protein n=1 Tax=Streptomyces sp. NPDC050535 TaxID=3365626 RepID=UPI0037BC9AAD
MPAGDAEGSSRAWTSIGPGGAGFPAPARVSATRSRSRAWDEIGETVLTCGDSDEYGGIAASDAAARTAARWNRPAGTPAAAGA